MQGNHLEDLRDTPETLTFLFTDIEGSTPLWERQPQTMQDALAEHDELLRSAVEAHGGRVFATGGDGLSAVFRSASEACEAALSAQRALAVHPWVGDIVLKVRMGLHSGEAHERAGDFFGVTVNRAARVMGVAHAGQIVLSAATAELVRDGLPEGSSLLDLGEHPLRGLLRSERLAELVAHDLGNRFGRVRAVAHQSGNIPQQLTSFVGRVRPLDRLVEDMSGRLVTVTGPGGVGKTRLAVEAAQRVSNQFPGGVWLCELAPLRDLSAVPYAVMEALQFRFHDNEDVTQMLVEGMRARGRTLVLIDNCEHLLDAATALAGRIASSCPETSVLATSREPLGVPGEKILHLGPLDVVTEAIDLFVERARAADDRFSPTERDAETIRQICARLDGMPLAVELAAARVRAFSLGDLARRLEDRLALLRNPARGADRRHETLRAALDWSYQLLDKPSRRLFSRLSVFAGGFDIAAAEAVCGTQIDDEQLLELLVGLVDKSLVVADRSGAVTRYRLLDTMRQFAAETLAADDPSPDWQDRHLRHYEARAKLAADNYAESGFDAACEWFELEWDNLRAAFNHAVATDQLLLAAAITENTAWWSLGTVRSEHAEWLQRLAVIPACPISVAALRAVWSFFLGDHAGADLLARRVISATGDPFATWHAWHAIGEVAFHTGHIDETLRAFAAMADAASRTGQRIYDVHTKWLTSISHSFVANEVDAAEAWARLERHASETGNTLYLAIALSAAGNAALAAGDRPRAVRRFTESAEIARAAGLGVLEGVGLTATVLGATGPDRLVAYQHALRRVHEARSWVHVWVQLEGLGSTWAIEGRHEPAGVVLGAVDARDRHVPSLNRRRARAEQVLSPFSERPDWAAVGAAMDVDQIVAYALDQLNLEISELGKRSA